MPNLLGTYILKFALVFSAFFILGPNGNAQTTTPSDSLIRIINANRWEFDNQKYQGGQLLRGAVVFEHKGARLFCDSALLFKKENRVLAYSQVYFNQGDSLEAWGDFMQYEGNLGYGQITQTDGEVKVETDSVLLWSPEIEYYREQNLVQYTQGGRMKSRSGVTQLTSDEAYFYQNDDYIRFLGNVVLDHETVDLHAPQLHFNTQRNVVVFVAPTLVLFEDSTSGIRTEDGWFNIDTEYGEFFDQSCWFSGKSELCGDTLKIFDGGERAEGYCFVHLKDSVEQLDVHSDSLIMENQGEKALLWGGVLMEQRSSDDTLYVFSPQLEIETDLLQSKTFVWSTVVRMFSQSFQAKADTVVYSEADSSFFWYGGPVLWNEDSQITGSEIRLTLSNKKLHELYIPEMGFMSSDVGTGDYNQISGKSILGKFEDNKLKTLTVKGNGESLYFALDEKDSTLIGMNKAAGSSIEITMGAQGIDAIEFLTQPTSIMYPETEIPNRSLKRFYWRGAERPKTLLDILKTD